MTKSSSSQVQEINPERNSIITRLRQNLVEYVAVIVAAVAVSISLLSALMSMLAGAQVWAMERAVDDMREEMSVQRIYINQLHADLKARGFQLPEKEE